MKTRGYGQLVPLAIALAAAAPLSGQSLTTKAADPADVETLDGIISAFYDVISHAAGQPIDWARDSTLYLADLRFRIVGGGGVQIIDHAGFARANADVSQGFFEREVHRVTQRFGPIAQVWSTYEWRASPDGPVGGRGINSIELVFHGGRWWIGSATWTSETPENPIPAEYLPMR